MTPYPLGERIEQVFAHHAERTPDAVAVQQGNERLTYGELRHEAGRVTSSLRDNGIGPGDFVPVLLDRSPRFVATLLGILGAGAAYIALDPAWPRSRIDDIVTRSGSRLVADAAFLDALPVRGNDFGDLTDGTAAACVFFTSGSTGRPKGVISPHRGTVRIVVGFPTIPVDRDTVFLQSAPVPWDAHSLDLWAPLLGGGRCVLLDRGVPTLDASGLRSAIDQGANSLWLTSSLLNVLVEEDLELFRGIRLLLTGGERVSPAHAGKVLDRFPCMHFVNGYGPAESTIFTTAHRIRPEDVGPGSPDVPIGAPVPHTGVTLLGPDGNPVPQGEIGELAVSGDGLAAGYLGDEVETGLRFFTIGGVRHYRTGDLAQADEDGTLRYRGRADRQFKVNGLRVEPGEVEAVLEAHPAISSCHVVRVEPAPGRAQVGCVYTTSDATPVELADLRAFASAKLLKGMLPGIARHVPRLPLSANGKVDSAAAARLILEGRTETRPDEQADVFLDEVRALLGRPDLALHDDLLAAGIDSLDAIRLSARLSARSGARIPTLHAFREPTVAALLKAAAAASEGHSSPRPTAAAGDEPVPLSHAQERFWLAEQFFPGAADNIAVLAYLVTGPLDPDTLQAALDDVVARHPALRTLYAWSKPTATQRILDARVHIEQLDADLELPTRDLAEHLTADWFDTPFELTEELPLRARLYRLADERHLFCLHVHHVAFDGWSEAVLIRDLCDFYAARTEHRPPLHADPAITYADYARWERAEVDHWLAEDLPFWQDTVKSCPDPFLPAPADPDESARLETVLEVSPAVVDGLGRAAARHGSPLLGALLAATAQALTRALGVRDVCLGTLTMGRDHPQLEPLVGYFVNPLAVPMRGVPELTDGELLTAAGESVAAVLEHSRTPFDRLVFELRPNRERNPWFQAWAVLHRAKPSGRLGASTTLESVPIRAPRTSFELMVEAFPRSGGGWDLTISQRADGIDADTHQAVVSELRTAVQALSEKG
jgi:mycobactin peptide synthetase MbtE